MTAHTVKSYDADLKYFHDTVIRMGSLAKTNLVNALQAVIDHDKEMAKKIIASDDIIDELEANLYDFTIKVLALRQPMGNDLRNIISALKLSNDIERIGDYASSIAKKALKTYDFEDKNLYKKLNALGEIAVIMLSKSLEIIADNDLEKTYNLWLSDNDLDHAYKDFLALLTKEMGANSDALNAYTNIMFIAKNIERVGDRCTNIAEIIHYNILGKNLTDILYEKEE